MSRKALSKRTRFEVFKRDGFVCTYCGATPPRVILHCDHVFPVALGGTNDIDNLVTACSACNLGKSAELLTSVPKTLEEKANLLREREEQVTAYNALIASKQDRIERDAWLVADRLLARWGRDGGSFRRDWFASIERFVDLLSLDELLQAAAVAGAKYPYSEGKSFRYFCGICWNKVRDA